MKIQKSPPKKWEAKHQRVEEKKENDIVFEVPTIDDEEEKR